MSVELSLNTLAYLMRALSHRLRTPLSVISNDLAYLSSKYPEVLELKAEQKCREISDTLHSLSAALSSATSTEAISIGALSMQLRDWQVQCPESLRTYNCPTPLAAALTLLPQIARELQRRDPQPRSTLLISSDQQSVVFKATVDSEAFEPFGSSQPLECRSFTELFFDKLQTDCPSAALLDSFFAALKITPQIILSRSLHLTVNLPNFLA